MDTKDLVKELETRLLTVEAASVFLDTHPSYVWRLLKLGKLETVRAFGRTLFTIDSLKVELERRRIRRERPPKPPQKKKELSSPYEGWNIRDLQRECKYRGLKVKGRKASLVERLSLADKK